MVQDVQRSLRDLDVAAGIDVGREVEEDLVLIGRHAVDECGLCVASLVHRRILHLLRAPARRRTLSPRHTATRFPFVVKY